MEQFSEAAVVEKPPVNIKIVDLSKTFTIRSHSVHALRDINLEIRQGQVIAVTGRSGSGKSTLLHILATLDTPSSGKVYINNTDTSKIPDNQISHFRNYTIGLVFQMNNLLADFSALENTMMPGLIAGISRKQIEPRAKELLTAVGLESRLDHRPGELSGGEQQRVAIARALLMEPPILLADEPTGNLDKRNSDSVRNLLLDLCRERKITMLLVTHDLELARSLPTQVVMEDGQVVELGGSW
ncbi:MAG: ABC transporter ATP-binding protein [Oligoflexales bacterium]